MFGWHHRLNGYEFEQTLGDGEGQGSLVCCSPRGHKESDMTEQLNNNKEKAGQWLPCPGEKGVGVRAKGCGVSF